jgi:hypothetical protein
MRRRRRVWCCIRLAVCRRLDLVVGVEGLGVWRHALSLSTRNHIPEQGPMDHRPTRGVKHLRRSRGRKPARQARSQHARQKHNVTMKALLQKVSFN